MSYFLYNGNFHPLSASILSVNQLNRILFSDELRVVKSNILFWKEHLQLQEIQFKLFNLPIPGILANDGKELKRQIERSLVKNKYFNSAIIRVYFLKSEKQIDYLIELFTLKDSTYSLNPNGFSLTLFKQITKSDSPLSALSIGSEKIWEMAKAYQQNGGGIPVILNNNHDLLEVPGANLFIIKDQTIRTPAPQCGTYINPAKMAIKKAAENLTFNFEEEILRVADLEEAEEIFIASDIQGIQFIRAFGMKRYFRKQVELIAGEFNRTLVH